ncbi:hypothetical protein J113_07885 [Mycobacterium tuberculosis CAS/NITR204]|uniref:O-acyltransferase WSD1 C-terminal domain-containing protein n=1 Tax=Mycobacterium tuberculosis CAS/NITR204 TaxID=1310114 RepID=R4M703_MYCTX|nr:hypothetical protein J113_07885 [Mycobacterium tuberculosis CAS/NITR204]
MAGHRMAAVDAQFYWMSAKVPNDQFLLYAFDGEPTDLERAVAQVYRRARGCPGLGMRVQDRGALAYPQWVPTPVQRDQLVCHDLADRSWQGCLAAVVGLASKQLECAGCPGGCTCSPRCTTFRASAASAPSPSAVRACAGRRRRASAMAAWLFGRPAAVPEIARSRAGFLPWRAAHAARAHLRLVRDTNAGLVAPGVGSRPPLSTNARPEGVRAVRTLLRRRSQLAGPTVTVTVLAAVSTGLLGLLGGDVDTLGAEVPMAKPGVPRSYNHFGNVVVGLYPRLEPDERVRRIATDLANARRRFEHPAMLSADRAFAAVPAALLRWGVSQFDAEVRPVRVAGNTVVSSVYRGAADLSFGDAPVVLTAGYPALSPAMGLTHGVHGIGDTVAISVHAAESAVSDIDAYMRLLDAALQ